MTSEKEEPETSKRGNNSSSPNVENGKSVSSVAAAGMAAEELDLLSDVDLSSFMGATMAAEEMGLLADVDLSGFNAATMAAEEMDLLADVDLSGFNAATMAAEEMDLLADVDLSGFNAATMAAEEMDLLADVDLSSFMGATMVAEEMDLLADVDLSGFNAATMAAEEMDLLADVDLVGLSAASVVSEDIGHLANVNIGASIAAEKANSSAATSIDEPQKTPNPTNRFRKNGYGREGEFGSTTAKEIQSYINQLEFRLSFRRTYQSLQIFGDKIDSRALFFICGQLLNTSAILVSGSTAVKASAFGSGLAIYAFLKKNSYDQDD